MVRFARTYDFQAWMMEFLDFNVIHYDISCIPQIYVFMHPSQKLTAQNECKIQGTYSPFSLAKVLATSPNGFPGSDIV